MTSWQHAWISVDPMKADDIGKLESFGREGWQLVSVLPWGQAWQMDTMAHMPGDSQHAAITQTGSSVFLMFFKRPIEEDSLAGG